MAIETDSIAVRVVADWEEAKKQRQQHEKRWLDDMYQYRGQYSAEELANMPKGRSQLYLRYTRKKSKAILAKLMDLLFPANDRNWGRDATPVPQIGPEMTAQFAQAGADVETMKRLIRDECENRAEAMATEIEDQLEEDDGCIGYRESIRRVLQSGIIYGTGVLKGPLPEEKPVERWGESGGGWEYGLQETEITPFYEQVPIWDFYPDMTAVDIQDARFVIQRRVMGRSELVSLAKRPQFDAEVIKRHLRDFPQGSAPMTPNEMERRSVVGDSMTGSELKNRYVVLEYWGRMSGQDLNDVGVEMQDEDLDQEQMANVWVLGSEIIRVDVHPVEGAQLPYHLWHFDKDENSIWGESLPAIIRHEQRALNGSLRMLLDNAAISCGPQFSVNEMAMPEGENVYDIYPFKVWRFGNVKDMSEAMQVWTIPSYSTELSNIAALFRDYIDEVTIPASQFGGERIRGAGETATGLSMLMGNSGIELSEMIKRFDDNVTKPFFKMLYQFNMQFNLDESIKGDYNVKARGVTALMAREVRADKLAQAINVTQDPRFSEWINPEKLLQEYLQNLGLPTEGIIKTKEEHDSEMQQQQSSAAQAPQTLAETALARQRDAQAEKAKAEAEKIEGENQMRSLYADTAKSIIAQGTPALPGNPGTTGVSGMPGGGMEGEVGYDGAGMGDAPLPGPYPGGAPAQEQYFAE